MARQTMAAVGAVVALCAAAPAAQAHYLTVGEATCTGLSASYAEFSESNKPIDYAVTVDSSPSNAGSFTFSGPSGTLTVTFFAPLATGDHVVTFTSTWPHQGSENGSFSKHVYGCPSLARLRLRLRSHRRLSLRRRPRSLACWPLTSGHTAGSVPSARRSARMAVGSCAIARAAGSRYA